VSDSELDRRKFLRRSALLGATAVGYDLLVTPAAAAWTQTARSLQAPGDPQEQDPQANELLVAASNSTSRRKASAAYVCDGIADEVEIVAACNEAELVGGTVLLSEGTFHIDAPIQKAPSGFRFWNNLTIQGQGRSTRIHNRQDIGGGDIYAIYVRGSGATNLLSGVTLRDFVIYGDEYLTNTKGQHGVHVQFAKDFSFDNLWFETLSEEGLALDHTTFNVHGGRLYGYRLGSAVLDSAGTEHVSIDQIYAEEVCQVETDSASVQIFEAEVAGRICKKWQIGRLHSVRSGAIGLKLDSCEDVNVGQVIVDSQTSGSTKSRVGVLIDKSPNNAAPQNINLGQVVIRNAGAHTPGRQASMHVLNAHYVNLQQLVIAGAYGHGLYLQNSTQCHFGQLIVHDPIDTGQNPAPAAVCVDAASVDNTFNQIVVRGWVWGAANGQAVTLFGDRNLFGLLQVSGDAGVIGADSWDFIFNTGAADNILDTAIISGHGTGGIHNGGTGNQVGRVVKGTNGINYKPYQNSGTATVSAGATWVDVTHGLAFTPTARNIELVPTNNLGAAAKWWVSNLGATTFRINTDVDPGAGTAAFAWRAGPA